MGLRSKLSPQRGSSLRFLRSPCICPLPAPLEMSPLPQVSSSRHLLPFLFLEFTNRADPHHFWSKSKVFTCQVFARGPQVCPGTALTVAPRFPLIICRLPVLAYLALLLCPSKEGMAFSQFLMEVLSSVSSVTRFAWPWVLNSRAWVIPTYFKFL